jgi:hypothetical protein
MSRVVEPLSLIRVSIRQSLLALSGHAPVQPPALVAVAARPLVDAIAGRCMCVGRGEIVNNMHCITPHNACWTTHSNFTLHTALHTLYTTYTLHHIPVSLVVCVFALVAVAAREALQTVAVGL